MDAWWSAQVHGSVAGLFYFTFIDAGHYAQLLIDAARRYIGEPVTIGKPITVGLETYIAMHRDIFSSTLRRGLGPRIRGNLEDERDPVNDKWIWELSMVPSVLDISMSNQAPNMTIRVWSALVSDQTLETYIQYWLRNRSLAADRSAPREMTLAARLREFKAGSGLSCIEITASGGVATAKSVAKWFREGPWKHWQQKLWDGREDLQRRRLPKRETIVRGWTLYALTEFAGFSLRDAMYAWNSHMPESLHLTAGTGPLAEDDPQASRERSHAQEAAQRLRSFLGKPWTLA